MARWSEALDQDTAPVPGDADQILNLGWRLRNQSNAIATDVRELRRIAANKAELAMYGNYAPKVSEAITEIPGQLERLGNAYWDCGQALKTYGNKLRELQNQANTVRSTATGNVEAAKKRLTGIVETYKRAEESCAKTIEGALAKHRIKNKDLLAKAWEKVRAVGRWLSKWENIVKVATVVATVVGIIALIIGSGGLAAIALIAGAVVLIDALLKYSRGEADLGDVALAALGVIPGVGALGRVAGGLGRVATAVRAARVGGGLTRAAAALGRADAAIGRGVGAVARRIGSSRVGKAVAGSRVGQAVGQAYGRAQVIGAKVDLGMSKALPGRLGGNALASAAQNRLTAFGGGGADAATAGGTRAADDAPEPQPGSAKGTDTPEPQTPATKARESGAGGPEPKFPAAGPQRHASDLPPARSDFWPAAGPPDPPGRPIGPASEWPMPPAAYFRSSPTPPYEPEVPPWLNVTDERWVPIERGRPPIRVNTVPVNHPIPESAQLMEEMWGKRGNVGDIIAPIADRFEKMAGKAAGNPEAGAMPTPDGATLVKAHTETIAMVGGNVDNPTFQTIADNVNASVDAWPLAAAVFVAGRKWGPPTWQGAKALGRAFRSRYEATKGLPPDAGGYGPFAPRTTRVDLDEPDAGDTLGTD